MNILALSKLLYVSRVLVPPKWVYSKLNSLIWPFLWRARLETVARKSLICSVDSEGLGLKDFFLHHPDFPCPLVRFRPLSVFPFLALGSDSRFIY